MLKVHQDVSFDQRIIVMIRDPEFKRSYFNAIKKQLHANAERGNYKRYLTNLHGAGKYSKCKLFSASLGSHILAEDYTSDKRRRHQLAASIIL
jgi:hypothetical protein